MERYIKKHKSENESADDTDDTDEMAWKCKRSFVENPSCELEFRKNILSKSRYDSKDECDRHCEALTEIIEDEYLLTPMISSMLDNFQGYPNQAIKAIDDVLPITIKKIPNHPGVEFTLESIMNPNKNLRNFVDQETSLFKLLESEQMNRPYEVNYMEKFGIPSPKHELHNVFKIAKRNKWIEQDMSFDNFWYEIYVPFMSQNRSKIGEMLSWFEYPWGKNEWAKYARKDYKHHDYVKHPYIAYLSSTDLADNNIFMIVKVSYANRTWSKNVRELSVEQIMESTESFLKYTTHDKFDFTKEDAIALKKGQMVTNHFSIARSITMWLCSKLFPGKLPKSMSNVSLMLHSISASVMYQLYPNIVGMEINQPLPTMYDILKKGANTHGYEMIRDPWSHFISLGPRDNFRDIWCSPFCKKQNVKQMWWKHAEDFDFEKIKKLIKSELVKNVDMKDDEGGTIMFYGPDSGTIKMLVAAGADINVKNNDGRTPLLDTTYSHDTEFSLVSSLIENGADVNATDNEGETLLHHAWFDEDVTNLLIKSGADINAQCKAGYTALMNAALDGKDNEDVERLVELGADVNIKNNEGKRAIDFCHNEDCKEILEQYKDIDAFKYRI